MRQRERLHVITCTRHEGFYFFCYHCKIEVPGGENSACECPKRNNKETRLQQVEKRTEKSRQNPTEITSDAEEDIGDVNLQDVTVDKKFSVPFRYREQSQQTQLKNIF
jgi:hypothetical protein